jgi:hypothetical protein
VPVLRRKIIRRRPVGASVHRGAIGGGDGGVAAASRRGFAPPAPRRNDAHRGGKARDAVRHQRCEK